MAWWGQFQRLGEALPQGHPEMIKGLLAPGRKGKQIPYLYRGFTGTLTELGDRRLGLGWPQEQTATRCQTNPCSGACSQFRAQIQDQVAHRR